LVLTFSRKAAGEFRARLPPEAQEAAVSTFHAWAWQLLRRHWAEAGFPRRPAVLLPEQELGIMRDCLAWERLAALQAAASAWLFLPPSTPWPHIVRTAAERHGQLFQRCLRCAVQLYNSDRGGQALPLEQAADASFADLPFRLQQLLVAELHDALSHSVGSRGQPAGGGSAMEMLLAAEQEADACLQWTEAEKRGGRLPDAAAYAALSAGAGLCRDPELAERQRLAARVGAAFQLELRRQGLAALADLPLLARSLLERGGDALAWARDRWRYVLVDEFQDCSSTMVGGDEWAQGRGAAVRSVSMTADCRAVPPGVGNTCWVCGGKVWLLC
jgi:ATP-dependent exoDNAse (exonuclease V) beta subunit